jgi:hypothetical protein
MADAIPGLALDGETVTLDGKSLDALSGSEQMRFCIEVARRANAKSRIIVVDGLERIDPEQYAAFVQQATAGGFQLFGTRVAGGGLELEAVEISMGPRIDVVPTPGDRCGGGGRLGHGEPCPGCRACA